jgi:small GTP-binding protein
MKILVVGNIGAGKTAIVQRYAGNGFTENYKATIGVDFAVKNDVTLWDIAGQERFGNMTTTYYRGAEGAIVVVDWTNRDSINAAEKWIYDLNSKIDVPIVLFANKCDKPSVVNYEDVDTIRGVIGWKRTSAKTEEGIHEGVNMLIDMIKVNKKEKETFLTLEKKPVVREERCC